jgi:uncharacterized protein involved in copper resistance
MKPKSKQQVFANDELAPQMDVLRATSHSKHAKQQDTANTESASEASNADEVSDSEYLRSRMCHFDSGALPLVISSSSIDFLSAPPPA